MKRRVLKILTADVLAPLRRPLTRGVATVLMMHRFRDGGQGQPGHDLGALRRHLHLLRRNRYNLVSLDDLVRSFRESIPIPPRTAVFTVDDGYADFQRAAPIFAEFDCPVTVFLITRFVGGQIWCWWDRIEFAFQHTDLTRSTIETSTGPLRLSWGGAKSRRVAARRLCERLKNLPDAERECVLEELGAQLEVEVPSHPPEAYAALTWDAVRSLEAQGVSFGPHTCTHPIMSRVDDERAEWEVVESLRTVRKRVRNPTSLFCFPNGDRGSFSDRDQRILAMHGVLGAVTAIHGYARADRFLANELSRYAIPRFPYYDSRLDFIQVTSGIERLKRIFR